MPPVVRRRGGGLHGPNVHARAGHEAEQGQPEQADPEELCLFHPESPPLRSAARLGADLCGAFAEHQVSLKITVGPRTAEHPIIWGSSSPYPEREPGAPRPARRTSPVLRSGRVPLHRSPLRPASSGQSHSRRQAALQPLPHPFELLVAQLAAGVPSLQDLECARLGKRAPLPLRGFSRASSRRQ